jgi:hypothetical protein
VFKKISKHFTLEELFPRDMVNEFSRETLLTFIDHRILTIADFLRDCFGPATINNWIYGGSNHQCGFRAPDSKVGARLSQHKFGRAIDLHFTTTTAEEAREEIRKNQDKYASCGISAVEEGVNWLHTDCRWIPGLCGILFFKG